MKKARRQAESYLVNGQTKGFEKKNMTEDELARKR